MVREVDLSYVLPGGSESEPNMFGAIPCPFVDSLHQVPRFFLLQPCV